MRKIELFNDHFQNYKVYGIPKAQLIIADPPYNLEKLAIKSGDEDFMDGIKIIKEAYRPVPTCQFIEATFRDENGKEHNIPLSMSAID